MEETFAEGWAVVETLGHRRTGGYVQVVAPSGLPLIRVDVPRTRGEPQVRFYGAGAIYCISPCTEDEATKVAHYHESPLLTGSELGEVPF